jgi:hypothetical protein
MQTHQEGTADIMTGDADQYQENMQVRMRLLVSSGANHGELNSLGCDTVAVRSGGR